MHKYILSNFIHSKKETHKELSECTRNPNSVCSGLGWSRGKVVRESFFMVVILELSKKGYIEIKEIKGQGREIF